jgi:hypothetical protein
VSSSYPSGEPAAFAAAPSSGCADFKNLRLAPTAPDSGSTGGQLPRLGSVFCHPARPVAKTSDFRRLLRTADQPSADLPACAGVPPRARLETTSDSHLALFFGSARIQPPALTGCCCNLQLALSAATTSSLRWLSPVCRTSSEPPTRIGGSSTSFTGFNFTQLAPYDISSGWAFDAPLASTEPCIAS